MKSYADMDERTADLLKELGNIGIGNAVTALAQMVGKPIEISLPSLHLAQAEEIYAMLEKAQEIEAGILIDIRGGVTGQFLFLLNQRFTNRILNEIAGECRRDILNLGELERSILCELGNIMCGSYVSALSTMLDIEMNVSVPDVCVDMGGAILSVPLTRVMSKSADILLIDNEFHIDCHSFSGRILFFPDPECLEPILMKLRV